MMNLISANVTHKEQLMSLWRQCFDADERYLDLAFGRPYPLFDTKLLFEGARVAAALSLLPCSLGDGTHTQRGYYIYGVGTLPEFRKRGLSTQLMRETLQLLAKKGADFAVLMPAQKSLFSFYQKQGFDICSCVSIRRIAQEEQKALIARAANLRRSEGWSIEPLNRAEEYDALRRTLLHGHDAIHWEPRHYQYADRESTYYGGHLFLLRSKGKAAACAACWPQEHEGKQYVIVKEFLCHEQERENCLALLAELAGKRQMILRLPPWEAGEKHPFGMIRWLREPDQGIEQEAYLALTLD